MNASDIESQEDLEARVRAAAFIGTLQAGYTDFHYLRPVWKRTTEKDALIGVSMTGIGSGAVLGYDMKAAAKAVKEENARVADLIAARILHGPGVCCAFISCSSHSIDSLLAWPVPHCRRTTTWCKSLGLAGT